VQFEAGGILLVVVTTQVAHISLSSMLFCCCRFYRNFWGIVILNTTFIRACGSFFGIFLPVVEIEAFKELVSLEKPLKVL